MIKLAVSGLARRHRVAINAGGSIVAPDEMDAGFLRGLGDILIRASEERDLLIVVGGGRTARRYIEAGRALGADEGSLDHLGIEATRLNARLLMTALGERAHPGVPSSVEGALEALGTHPVVVMGGTIPGQTTDAVSAMLAQRAEAVEMIVLTNVDGVYTADPRKDPSAERLERIPASRLVEIVGGGSYEAGSSTVVDPVAAGIIQSSHIPTKVLDGRDLDQVSAALAGEDFRGTLVTPDG